MNTTKVNKDYNVQIVTKKDFGQFFYDYIRYEGDKFIQKDISKTSLFRYFINFLLLEEEKGLGVKTIVVEKDYTCLSYLEDYANYYAKCYTLYDKHCKRIHFLSTELTVTEFENKIRQTNVRNGDTGVFWDDYYLGCVVIKPLPKGVFGVSYLKTYKEEYNGKIRHYKCLTEKTINLFGHDIVIKTMPFKEQDGVVASCATTAIWMAFQKTSELFGTKTPSLSEITILAGDKALNSGKIFPSRGLDIMQVCKAINNNGLISELRDKLERLDYFKSFVYAYLKADIPVLLTLQFESTDLHLITLNGYRIDEEKESYQFVSDKIDRFYAHDDQVGPFSRLIINCFDNQTDNKKYGNRRGHRKKIERDRENVRFDYEIITSWWKKEKLHEWVKRNDFMTNSSELSNIENFERSVPYNIIVPLDPQIKVTFDDIAEQRHILSFLTDIFLKMEGEGKSTVWDTFLIKSNEYKKWYLENYKGIRDLEFEKILTKSFPKYIWVVRAWAMDDVLFDFIYDSVELNKTGQPTAINLYSPQFKAIIKDLGEKDKIIEDCFSLERFKGSLINCINQIPYDLKIIKEWLKGILNKALSGDLKEWDITKKQFAELLDLQIELDKQSDIPLLDLDFGNDCKTRIKSVFNDLCNYVN